MYSRSDCLNKIDQTEVVFELNQIVENSVGHLYWKNLAGRYQGCNREFLALLGLASVDDLIGMTDFDLLPEAEANRVSKNDKEVIERGEALVYEEIGKDPKGKYAIYLTKKAPLFNSKHTICGLVGTSIDVTNERQAQKAKTSFVQNMQHDFRTPFSGILGVAQILYAEETEPQRKEYLEYISKSSEQLLKMLNQVLDLIDSKGMPDSTSSFDIRDLLSDILDVVKPSQIEKSISISTSCPRVTLESDSFRIQRILLNLTNNAIRFVDTGGQIKVDIRVTDGYLFIVVEDNGIGIAEEEHSTIFEEFYKVAPSNKFNTYKGIGHGLSMTKNFVRDLNGIIEIDSSLGNGARFMVKIPVKL